MEPDLPSVIEQLDLRVFIDFDEDYNTYVARCLETGAVATGATIEEAESLITAILQNDLRIAMEQGSLRSLFSGEKPPFEATVGWYNMKTAYPDSVRRISVDVSLGDVSPIPAKRSVQSEIRLIGRNREGSSAA